VAHLSGWNRIGIIASVAWILGAGIYTYNFEMNNLFSEHSYKRWSSCTDVHPSKDWSSICDPLRESTDEDEDLRRDTLASIEVSALVAFVPVPLGWGLVYLISLLVNWVKRGFREPLN
jgi:hypothetical protein